MLFYPATEVLHLKHIKIPKHKILAKRKIFKILFGHYGINI